MQLHTKAVARSIDKCQEGIAVVLALKACGVKHVGAVPVLGIVVRGLASPREQQRARARIFKYLGVDHDLGTCRDEEIINNVIALRLPHNNRHERILAQRLLTEEVRHRVCLTDRASVRKESTLSALRLYFSF